MKLVDGVRFGHERRRRPEQVDDRLLLAQFLFSAFESLPRRAKCRLRLVASLREVLGQEHCVRDEGETLVETLALGEQRQDALDSLEPRSLASKLLRLS